MRDFHASFKAICDNFSIDLSEFEHIFGASESAFVVFDTDNNGLIDSLELFSGIILFSDTKFEDKIRCKFYKMLGKDLEKCFSESFPNIFFHFLTFFFKFYLIFLISTNSIVYHWLILSLWFIVA